jgi:hypothetical protein
LSTFSSTVFISHVAEEAAIGSVANTWIEDAFRAHGVKAFLSRDRQDLPTGKKWRDVILEKLTSAKVVVSGISPTALARPWVNIELGAAWYKDLRIIPLCHLGQKFGALPPPFGDFHGVDLDQFDGAERLLEGVADGLGLQIPTRLHYAQCLKELLAAAKTIVTQRAPVTATSFSESRPKQHIALLVVAAKILNSHGNKDIP